MKSGGKKRVFVILGVVIVVTVLFFGILSVMRMQESHEDAKIAYTPLNPEDREVIGESSSGMVPPAAEDPRIFSATPKMPDITIGVGDGDTVTSAEPACSATPNTQLSGTVGDRNEYKKNKVIVRRSVDKTTTRCVRLSPSTPTACVTQRSVYYSLSCPPPSNSAQAQQPVTEFPNDMYFSKAGTNPLIDTSKDHLSTFAIDVDTASYTLVRNYLKQLQEPPKEAVRVEEFINYFDYNYTPPTQDAVAIHVEAAVSRFGQGSKMMRVGLQSKVIPENQRKKANLIFVIDVSGSMDMENRLGLVKQSLKMLTNQLRQGDRIGIVVYGSEGRVILKPTGVEQKDRILNAIGRLQSDGSTNVEEGLFLGYKLASDNYMSQANNRVILCTDGVANNGVTDPDQLLKIIDKHKDDGIYLSAIGCGMGNYNDELLEKLGDRGNGHYAYIDDLDEARRIFVENLTGTLQTVAKDTKVQVDFNPKVVKSYRLVGYENRDVADNQFRNDKQDGGEMGSGHTVTALYEYNLQPDARGTMATVYVRYKDPDTGKVVELSKAVTTGDLKTQFSSASDSFKLAACSAEYAEILRGSYWAKNSSMSDVALALNDLKGNIGCSSKVAELKQLIQVAQNLEMKRMAKYGKR